MTRKKSIVNFMSLQHEQLRVHLN